VWSVLLYLIIVELDMPIPMWNPTNFVYIRYQTSEHPERFFVGEIVREKIFVQYRQEIPYSCQVHILVFLTCLMQHIVHFGSLYF
jgi:GTPase Era involved in 16S rRNA processing